MVSADASSGIVITPSGIVRVLGAQVTAVGSDVISAVSQIGSVAINWMINTSASTKINGQANASSSPVSVGDRIAFSGSLASSSGSGNTVSANRLLDLTTLGSTSATSSKHHHKHGPFGLGLKLGFWGGVHAGDNDDK